MIAEQGEEYSEKADTPSMTSYQKIMLRISLDLKQQGVGGYDSWGAFPEEWARINPKQTYNWGFTIIPQ